MGASPKRLVVADARGQGGSLRITRHPEQHKVVLSQWRDGVCVATTPIDFSELPAIISTLAEALGDVATCVPPQPVDSKRGVLSRLRTRFRPKLAKVMAFHRSHRDL